MADQREPIDAFGLQLNRITPPPGSVYVPMSGRSMPGEGELPLGDIIRAALANTLGISGEVEVFNDELRALPSDLIAARTAAAVARWRARL